MGLNSPLLPLSTTAYQPTHKSLAFNRKVMSCRLVKLRIIVHSQMCFVGTQQIRRQYQTVDTKQ